MDTDNAYGAQICSRQPATHMSKRFAGGCLVNAWLLCHTEKPKMSSLFTLIRMPEFDLSSSLKSSTLYWSAEMPALDIQETSLQKYNFGTPWFINVKAAQWLHLIEIQLFGFQKCLGLSKQALHRDWIWHEGNNGRLFFSKEHWFWILDQETLVLTFGPSFPWQPSMRIHRLFVTDFRES